MSSSSLSAGQFIGLFKFFRERSHLDQFLEGTLYCNTPEYYRQSAAPGVSDRNDSCLISVRKTRGDSPFQMEIEGQHAGEVSDMIVRFGRKDGWLNCWAKVILPQYDTEFESLEQDFQRMQQEFGPHYVFVHAGQAETMVRSMASAVKRLECKGVTYYRNAYFGSSLFYKSHVFSYQREYRIVLDECDSASTKPRIINVKGGFKDIVLDCPDFIIQAQTGDALHELRLPRPASAHG